MIHMDKMKPPGKESDSRIRLTDEQKAEIRREMAKCETEQEAREFRKVLAEYYGVTAQQITGVAAYKVRPDGGLDLTPQFPKSSTHDGRDLPTVSEAITPKTEEVYDNPTKREWRKKIFEAIKRDFTEKELQNARVLCLPGQALQEVTEVYLPLGIRPENIVCVEQVADVAKTMKINAEKLGLPVTIYKGSLEKFLQESHEPVTIASFDILGPMYESFLTSIPNLRVSGKFMIVTNCLQRREKKDQQYVLRSATSGIRTLERVMEALPNYMHALPGLGSTLLDINNVTELIARTNKEPISLSEARDEGAAGVVAAFVIIGQAIQAVNELYNDTGVEPPHFNSDHDRQALERYMLGTMMRGIEQLTVSYPRVNSRLSMRTNIDLSKLIVSRTDKGKHGFLLNLLAVVEQCFNNLTLLDLQRYEYSSEKSGSPYQTDLLTFFDWKPSFREKHREAYYFIRDCLRTIAQHRNEQISFQFEKGGTVLPRNYAGSNMKIDLAVNINGTRFLSVSLGKLLELVTYFRQMEKIVTKGKIPQDFLERPRTKIEAQ